MERNREEVVGLEHLETGAALYLSAPAGRELRPEALARRVRGELGRRGLVCPGRLELEVFPSGAGVLVFVVSPVLRWARCGDWTELLAAARRHPAAATRGCLWCGGAWYIALPGDGAGQVPPARGGRVAVSGALLSALAGLSS